MAQFFKPQRRKVADTKHKSLLVTRLDAHGAGVGNLDGKTVFVDGVLPGEEALIQFTEQKRNYAKAKLIKLLKTTAERLPPFCQHYQRCGGCNLQHLAHQAQVGLKSAAVERLFQPYLEIAERVEPIIGDSLGYRRSARLSLWLDKQNQLQVGFREKGSKAIVDVVACEVLSPKLMALLPELKKCVMRFKQPRALGHIELIDADNGIVVMLRHTAALKPQHLNTLQQFAEQNEVMLFHSADGKVTTQLCGPAPYYEIEQCKVFFQPGDFIQVNRAVNVDMVRQALDWLELDSQERVLDLFCGLGNFSLPLATRVAEVVGVEGVDEMVMRAAQNAKANGLSNARFYQANLDEDFSTQVWAAEPFDKVLLDPARAGAAGVMEHVVNLAAKKVVYVSCNPATLARDSEILLKNGYQLTKLGTMDMFPHTGHTESMALFTKL
ncbi:23S rRNA (uracil(1939)-C(5))-methyltransferase RlmD [Thaumasiovibrio subtropicus]|uniref:23S rRNA (uracil(1939)-C(5))-methyltransferase RlmD n=1 Tax=Thaumasiovibrio subtropicus TaxID=1891207 RepID=UPI000B34AD70|nr:23S rRNA (uracil(1939)-C(5))-methyltransferase RlmD [Thaumasiovibrio subtropicus]